MSEKFGLIKVILLFVLILLGAMITAQWDRMQEELITIRKDLKGQGEVVQELNVSNKRLMEAIDKLQKTGLVAQTSSAKNHNPDPIDWVPNGILLDHGKNSILNLNSLPDPFPEAKESETLNLILETDFNYLNLLENSADLNEVEQLVWTGGLYGREFKQDGKYFYGALAKSVRISKDYRVYTIELRDDFYWHLPAVDLNNAKYKWLRDKGRQKVTAHDFVFTMMNIVMNKDTEASVARAAYDKLDRVEALDDYTLKIYWKEKTYPSVSFSSLGTCIPKYIYSRYENGNKIPENVLGEVFNKHWFQSKMIGYGPYRFVSYEKGKRLILERDDSFPLKKPNFKKIVYHIVKNPDQQLARFLRGEVDFIDLRASQYGSLINEALKDEKKLLKSDFIFPGKKEDGKFHWKKVPYPGYSYIGWNQAKPYFKDVNVRRAMTHALPIKDLIKDVWMGLGTILTGPMLTSAIGYDHKIAPLSYDLKKASALLDEAGWIDQDKNGVREKMIDGKKIELNFEVVHFSPMPEYDQMFALYSKKLKTIGVNCKGLGLDWPNMLKRIDEKNFDAVAMGWGLSYETDPYQIWHSSQADVPKGSNRIDFRMPEVDNIIMRARSEFDPEGRKKLFNRWHQIFHENQPYTIWRGSVRVYAWNKKLGQIRFDTRRPTFDITEWWDHTQE